jgi:hypothetical protein
MAGLGLFDQKSALAETMPIVTAFKFCVGHRKNGLLNRQPTEVKFWCFLTTVGFFVEDSVNKASLGGPKNDFCVLRV